MKRLLTAAFFLLSPLAFANPQYTQYDCDQLKTERENIRKRLNSGYRIREGNYLNERDRQLFLEISKHCRNPIKQDNDSNPVIIVIPSQTPAARSQPAPRPVQKRPPVTQPRTTQPPKRFVSSKPRLSEAQQVCNFWKQAYSNENNDRNYQRMVETCPEYQ